VPNRSPGRFSSSSSRLRPRDLFRCRRRSGLRFCGNSRYVISHAALFDIGVFGHIAFHHRFSTGSPFASAILQDFLFRALSDCPGWCGSVGSADRIGLVSPRSCGEMQDCHSNKHAMDQTRTLFHRSAPAGESRVSRETLLNAQSGSPAQINENPSRLFLVVTVGQGRSRSGFWLELDAALSVGRRRENEIAKPGRKQVAGMSTHALSSSLPGARNDGG
jgi:hypothetical protein